jgi:hypothetical protein
MRWFWNSVDKSGECWLWLGSKAGAGYGKAYFKGKDILAHRLAYILFVGEIPEKHWVHHK